MTRRQVVGTLVVVASLLLGVRTVSATWVSGNGNMCVGDGVNGTPAGGWYGVTNRGASNSSAYAYCPLPLGTQSSYPQVHTDFAAQYYDGNSANTFYCYVCQAYSGGTISCSTGKYTCSTYGGCNDSTMSFTGWNTLIWNQTDLGSNVYNQYFTAEISMFCGIPGVQNNNNSYILSYWSTLQ